MSKKLNVLLVLFLVMSLVVPFMRTSGTANAAGPIPFTILHTNDFHGFDPMALARKYTLINEIRYKNKNVLLLDGGDVFSRGQYHRVFFGEMEFAAMNAMRYDAWTLGNNELKCDINQASTLCRISDRAKQAVFPTLCANVLKPDGSLLDGVKDFTVKNVGGVKIGIFGVTNSDKAKTYSQMKGLIVKDAPSVAKALVPIVAAQSDIVIALSHAGLTLDRRIAETVRGITAIISADDHMIIDEPWKFNGVPVVQTGGEADQYLGRLDLTFKKSNGRWILIKSAGMLYPIDESIPANPRIKKIIDDYLDKAKKMPQVDVPAA
jgi:2',3'-cyclic-nucleotide 2'-phosphodiesterase (5'-nucleotidase family)